MKKPIIFALDDDPQVLRAVVRDLKARYREDYRILNTDDPKDALEAVEGLKKKGEVIALFVVDQRMPGMLGVEFLSQAGKIFPSVKKVLLTAYSDTDAAIRAINEVRLDYYLTKPWNPPEEKLYPVLDDMLEDWQIQYSPDYAGIRVIGYQYSPHSHEIRDFLSSNLFPFKWMDIESNEEARELVELHKAETRTLPLVIFEDGEAMKKPSVDEIADKLGLNVEAREELYDVVIIGGGPSGLAAAVYGGSEGLRTLLIEKRAPGGQAGSSSRIENYLGFPSGLSGQELTHRAVTQAKRFGVEILSPRTVTSIKMKDQYKILTLDNNSEIKTKSVIISTGVNYRKLPGEGIENFTGAGIYYGSSMSEAQSCREKELYIVGGGNSAGQAAVYLSNYAEKVTILIRKDDLTSSMSRYLIDQIEGIENITVLGKREIQKACGDNGHLTTLVLENVDSGETEEVKADALFIFIGSKPYTDWVPEDIIRNDKGFLETGKELYLHDGFKKIWKEKREPFLLETCVPGIFASGDVRAGAMNRVASAVGEGSMAIKFVHEYLAESV
jgi:thioredoxin reductase (NADPH)